MKEHPWRKKNRKWCCRITVNYKEKPKPLPFPLSRSSLLLRLNTNSLDTTDPCWGQRPPVLGWLNWWSDRGHIWPDREQAGWEWQWAPGLQAGDRWLTADAEVSVGYMESGEQRGQRGQCFLWRMSLQYRAFIPQNFFFLWSQWQTLK